MRHWSSATVVLGLVSLAAVAALGFAVLSPDGPVPGLEEPPPTEVADRAADVELPLTAREHARRSVASTTVVVSTRALSIGGDPIPVAKLDRPLAAFAANGAPAVYKRNPDDLFLADLAGGLAPRAHRAWERSGEPPTLGIVADAAAPYRLIADVLATAAEAGFRHYELASRSPSGRVGWSRADDLYRDAEVLLYVDDAGLSVRWLGGGGLHNVAPGCAAAGPGVTVPRVAGALDHEALAACFARLRASGGLLQGTTRIALHPSRTTEWGTVVHLVDDLGRADDAAGFEDVGFLATLSGLPSLSDDPRDRSTFGWLEPELPPAPPSAARPPATSRPLPDGEVSIGGPSVTGSSLPGATSTVAGMAAGFRRCYRKLGLAQKPTMRGTARLVATIGPAGEVLAVTTSGTGLSPEVLSCLQARLRSAQFEAPDGGGATIAIPVSCVPRDG